jgi:hypothetical protein
LKSLARSERAGSVPSVDLVVLVAPAASETPGGERAVADACSAALSDGACVFEPPAGEHTRVGNVAIELGASEARIVVRGPGGEAVRRIRFTPGDEAIERLRSTGLIAGTLAEGLRHAPPPPAEIAKTTEAPKPAAPVRAAPVVAPPPTFWLDLGAVAGPALDDGSWKGGPSLRASYAIAGLPIAGLVSARYGYRRADEAELSVHWFSGSVGLGGQLLLLDERLWLHARVELVGELIAAFASDPFTGREDQASRWLGGGRAGLDVAWMPHRNVGPYVGFDLTWLQSGTRVSIRDDATGRAPPYELGPSLGLRVAIP